MIGIALLLLSIAPDLPVSEERCGRLEYNHYYDGEGRLVFTQLIGWDWYEDEGCWHCCFFLMASQYANIKPSRNPQGGYAVTFYDHAGRLVRIEAASYAETWTQYDPELEDRAFLPKEHRRELVTLKLKRSN